MIRIPIQNKGPLRRDLIVISGTEYPDVTVKAPLGAMFQSIPEWTAETVVDLSTFVNTDQSLFGPTNGAIYAYVHVEPLLSKIKAYLGIV